jgi:hypothetical protein
MLAKDFDSAPGARAFPFLKDSSPLIRQRTTYSTETAHLKFPVFIVQTD